MHSTLILSRLLPFDIKMAWLYKAKRRKELGDNYVNRELVRPVYLGDLPHPAHGTHLYRRQPNRRQDRCDSDGIARRRGELVLDTTARFLLHSHPGGEGRAAKSGKRVKKVSTDWRDISEIVAEDRAVRLFWVRAHAGIAGNERNKLTERTALTKKTAATYDKFPLTHAKGDKSGEPGGITRTIRRRKHG
ncbi:hypothetical protein EVAR_34707_1 [Eumeta japonica]|uniref:RNase H type-1 domain-containing protein n=1 Tax=Eumeta variegata TaxID=151549 RepID=A0A4C1XC43_EUMVA|nr:hypothetical protein EVAR_34707_1 [Eumeta japonica]